MRGAVSDDRPYRDLFFALFFAMIVPTATWKSWKSFILLIVRGTNWAATLGGEQEFELPFEDPLIRVTRSTVLKPGAGTEFSR